MRTRAFRIAFLSTTLFSSASCAVEADGDRGSPDMHEVGDVDLPGSGGSSRADQLAAGGAADKLASVIAQNLVSLPEARAVAERFARDNGFASAAIAESDMEVDPETNDAVMYVFNFAEGGFVVVSADKREQAVLGYSEEGFFDLAALRGDDAPEGVRGFVADNAQYIHDLRVGLAEAQFSADAFETALRGERVRLEAQPGTAFFEIPNPDTCQDSYDRRYELNFPMRWNQDCGWNDNAPTASNGPCGRAYAGCVAVAMGQIMKYHRFPSTINWSAMSDTSPTPAAAYFLRQVGDSVDMDWGGDGSGADTGNVDNALERYGYNTSASYGDHSFARVRTDIVAGRPLVMTGTRDCTFPIFGFRTCGGHAFVVTGLRESYDCGTQTYPTWYKINWGWGGAFDGWFRASNLNPGGRNYNYHNKVVYGIRP
jgi:hypothetical protein